MLVEIDPRDYQVALDKARAELADAEAAALAAAEQRADHVDDGDEQRRRPRSGGVEQAQGGVSRRPSASVEAARARLATAQARQREAEANATKAARDVERLRGLLAKDEVSQQQFDAAVGRRRRRRRAAADSARSQVAEAEAGIRVAESRLVQARAGEQQAHAAAADGADRPAAGDAPRSARAASAEAHVAAGAARRSRRPS